MGQSYQQTTWVKAKDMKVVKTEEILEEDEEGSVLSSLDGDEMKKRLQNIIMKLEKLLEHTEGHERTQLLTFLCTIVAEFELEVDTDFRRFDTVTIQDRLSVLGESETGALCSQVHLSSKERGMDWDLNTIMRGLLSPKEISDVEKVAIESPNDESPEESQADVQLDGEGGAATGCVPHKVQLVQGHAGEL